MPNDRCPQLTDFRSWTNELQKAKSPILRNNQRAAMLCIGQVEEAESIDDLITSASETGRLIRNFENLDFKIASGLR